MDLTPWTTGDTAAQEQAGYNDGRRHCIEGWCVDSMASDGPDTPWSRGYARGWNDAQAAGLHGTGKPQTGRHS